MTTKLVKPVKRAMLGKPQSGKYAGREMLVTLEPGDELQFRPKGTRQAVTVSLAQCYNLALILDSERRYKDAVEKYKANKKAGVKRLRKPRKPFAGFFSKVYFKIV